MTDLTAAATRRFAYLENAVMRARCTGCDTDFETINPPRRRSVRCRQD